MKECIKFLVLILCSISASGQSQIPYGNNKAAGHFIKINNVRLYYEVYGSGPSMLLIHGNRTGIAGWAPQIAYFSKTHTVYAVDCRGRGKSELGKDSLTYIQMAADMARFTGLMKLDSVAVVGKSDGAIVALLMGIHYPAHLQKIVAFGANLWPDTTALYPYTVDNMKSERMIAEEMLAKGDTSKNWLIEQQRYRLMEFQPHITAKDLGKIKVPVLVMSCDRDVIREEHTFFIYKHIPMANLSIFPGEVHRVSTLNPGLFNATVDTFLTRPFASDSKRFN